MELIQVVLMKLEDIRISCYSVIYYQKYQVVVIYRLTVSHKL